MSLLISGAVTTEPGEATRGNTRHIMETLARRRQTRGAESAGRLVQRLVDLGTLCRTGGAQGSGYRADRTRSGYYC